MAALIVFGVLFTNGCAKGYPAQPPEGWADALGSAPPGAGTGGNGAAGDSADAGAGTGMTSTGGSSADDECTRGETAVCTCESTQTEGERACVAVRTSPTGGYFGPCQNCKSKDPVSSSTGGSGAGGSGSGGSGSGGSSGTGGSGTGGSRGTGGSGTTGSGCTAMPCTGFLACCKPDGTCGTGIAPICI